MGEMHDDRMEADKKMSAPQAASDDSRLKATLQIPAMSFFSGVLVCVGGVIAGRILHWQNVEEIYPCSIGVCLFLFGFWKLITGWDRTRSAVMFAIVDANPSIRVPLALGLCLLWLGFAFMCVTTAVTLPGDTISDMRHEGTTQVAALPGGAVLLRNIVKIGILAGIVIGCLALLYPILRCAYTAFRVALGTRPSSTLTFIDWLSKKHTESEG